MQRLTDLSPQRLALLALDLQERLKSMEGAARAPIAIVGMSCNLPGAPSIEAYWDLLSSGRDGISEMPQDRWDPDAFYSADPDAPGRYYTKTAGFVTGHDQFDPAFFGLSPVEAANIDPQHRLLLESTWHALENAGLPREALVGKRVGNFVGISTSDYLQYQTRYSERAAIGPYLGTGTSASTAAGRVSYILGLNGPSLAVDTACSSSLIAAHLACQSLRLGESDVAIASGVNLMLIPDTFIYFCKLRALAVDGRCKTFDASADGYGRGEGAGSVVLKRLADAERDGDPIIALICGSDMNHSGQSNGLTVPSGKAQEAVVRTALRNAGMAPEDISFIEAHGTGTSLGDPIELHALGAVHRKRQDRLMIGSAKTNIGHLEAAAGIAGLIKTALALQHRQMPPHLNFNRPNPHVDWGGIPIDPVTRLTPLPANKLAGGVSSFGFGGSNAHMVLEAADPAPATATTPPARPAHLLTLTARSATALKRLAEATVAKVETTTDPAAFADYCYSANTTRSDFEHRLVLRAADGGEAADKLGTWMNDAPTDGVASHVLAAGQASDLAFVFSGQGAQVAGLGQVLYETHPVFRDSLDAAAACIGDRLDMPLTELMWGAGTERLSDTQVTQPVLYAFEVALARLWASFGVTPSMVLGHSVGE
ncbi:MAG: type I polyketide synthase, partial [Pseudomonadota bacterium]